jgi:hypothetical protein
MLFPFFFEREWEKVGEMDELTHCLIPNRLVSWWPSNCSRSLTYLQACCCESQAGDGQPGLPNMYNTIIYNCSSSSENLLSDRLKERNTKCANFCPSGITHHLTSGAEDWLSTDDGSADVVFAPAKRGGRIKKREQIDKPLVRHILRQLLFCNALKCRDC